MIRAIDRRSPAGALLVVLLCASCASQAERDERELLAREGVFLTGSSDRGETKEPIKAPVLGEDPGLPDFLRHAALNHPGLQAAYYRWKAALEEAPQSRSLPDPKLTYTYYIEEVETRVGPQKHRISLMQRFPWPSRLSRREEEAVRKARVQQYLYDATKLELFYEVKKSYYDYYYLARSINILQENISLLEKMEATVRARYRTGVAENPALIKIQVELGRLEDRWRSQEALLPALAARLNAAIGRNPNEPIPWPERKPEEEPALDEADLLPVLLEENPDLEAARERILAAEAGEELARTRYLPEFGIGASYIQTDRLGGVNVHDNGKDPWLLTFELSLPIWQGSYDAAVHQAEAEREAARKMHEDLRNRLSADLNVALYHYRDAGRKLHLFRDTLVPKADQALKTSQSAFVTGTASYLDMLDAERQLLEFRLLVERALVDRSIRLAELEKLCGRALRRE